jgi:hypothetical protein
MDFKNNYFAMHLVQWSLTRVESDEERRYNEFVLDEQRG